MSRNATRQMTRMCHVATGTADTCADSDNASDVAEETALSALTEVLVAHGVPLAGAKAAVGRLSIIRSAFRAGEMTESAMDYQSEALLRRLFAGARKLRGA